MVFTALHRAIGWPPGPVTDELLDAAVDAGVAETDDLDWKSSLPPARALPQTDFPKDVAAMANSGGGVIVYGVKEQQKAATGRVDVGELDESHERALRSAAISAITPPVFGLVVYRLGTRDRAVVVEVPAGSDVPHLIFRNETFGAPVRNDADTVWMRERQIEAMYRARFEERRRSHEALEQLYNEARAGRTDGRAWLIAVAHPRLPRVGSAPDRDTARAIFRSAKDLTFEYTRMRNVRPLEIVNDSNPRPGLRRWVAPNAPIEAQATWREAWISACHDGSVTLAASIGGQPRNSQGNFPDWVVISNAVEGAIADFMALIRATSRTLGTGECDAQVGIEWDHGHPLEIVTTDNTGFTYRDMSTPLHAFSPVLASVEATATDTDFHHQVADLAQDCINQGGITHLQVITRPVEADE